MSADEKISAVLDGLSFLGLAGAVVLNLWGRTSASAPILPVEPQFTNTAMVRINRGVSIDPIPINSKQVKAHA